jgi:hypothetical protein
MAVGAVIGFCFLLRLDIIHAFMMFLTFVAPALVMTFHYSMFGDFMAYVKFNQKRQKLVEWPPLSEIRSGRMRDSSTNYLHSFIDFYGLYILQALLVIPVAGPIGVLCAVWVLYIACLRHMDIARYSLPGGVFGLLIGLDKLWSSRVGIAAMVCCAPFYLMELLWYGGGQINSNRCGDGFFSEVLDAAVDHMH